MGNEKQGVTGEASVKRKKAKAATKPAKKATAATKATKEDLCVFALRLTEHERAKFHEATGPAGASRFARKLMVVFANEDETGFRALLKEARELRA